MVGKSLEKLAKSIATGFVGMRTCIGRAIPNYHLKQVYELHCLRQDLHRNWTGSYERSLESGIDTGDEQNMVLLDSLLLLAASIYKR